MNKIEVLISTMFDNLDDIIARMNLQTDALIINQCDINEYEERIIDNNLIRFVSTTERGLSRSRNMALSLAKGDIVYISDNDIVMKSDFVSKIQTAYSTVDADIIVFQVVTPNVNKPKFGNKMIKLSHLKAIRAGSVTITMKRDRILEKNIKFNTLFGTGSGHFYSGEEGIFMHDCVRNKLSAYYFPDIISQNTQAVSTWFNGYTDQFFERFGAFYCHLFGPLMWLVVIRFLFRFYKLYHEDKSVSEVLKCIINGRRKYKELIKNEDGYGNS